MRKISLFIAMSLDGYIADSTGSLDWLQGQGEGEDIDTYSEFIRDVDTILMGWNTYHQIVTELSPDKWIYHDFITYVLTHNEETSSEKIRFVNKNPADLIKSLKKEKGKDIWICGGADIVHQFMQNNLIDKYYISVIPTILGDGIRLFDVTDKK